MIKKKYTREELSVFREIILKKLEIAREDLKYLNGADRNENGTNDTAPIFKGSLQEGRTTLISETNARLALRKVKHIHDLEAALIRNESGNYGICRKTGDLIEPERLRATPHATLSIKGKELIEKEKLELKKVFNRFNSF